METCGELETELEIERFVPESILEDALVILAPSEPLQ